MQNTKPKKSLTKKSEILQEALKYLSPVRYCEDNDTHSPFICHCVSMVTGETDWTFPKDQSGLHSVIRTRLHPHFTFDEWLVKVGGISIDKKNANQGRKLQTTRKQWMLSMIEEFKAQGD